MAKTPLKGRRILVVEDDYLLAIMLRATLEEAGAEVVGLVGWLDQALEFIKDNAGTFDSAILDINLHGVESYPVADKLLEQGCGFIFVTGYGPDAVTPPYRHLPRCEKPCSIATLVSLLSGLADR